jgi:hypothetical protein
MERDPNEPPHYLAMRLREALVHDERVSEYVNVKITGDKVFVTGPASTPERREAITEVIRELVPEMRVCNETTVVRPGREPEEAEHLA